MAWLVMDKFGARTDGVLVILGAILLATAIFLRVGRHLPPPFPAADPGRDTVLTGAQLALSSSDISEDRDELFRDCDYRGVGRVECGALD